MRTLNLYNKSQSEINYKLTIFPDGQQSIRIDKKNINKEPVQIKSRMRNFLDVEIIICAKKSLDALGVKVIRLFVPLNGNKQIQRIIFWLYSNANIFLTRKHNIFLEMQNFL